MASNQPPAGQGDPDAEARAKLEAFCVDKLDANFPDVRQLTPQQVLEAAKERKVVLVDVREPAEREVSTIPNSIPVADVPKQRDELKDALVVCFCTVGYRSSKEARKLREQGMDAANLRGSILAWAHAGQPLVAGDGKETKRVHVFIDMFAWQPATYEKVTFSVSELILGQISKLYRRG